MYEPHDVTVELDGVGRELPGPLQRSRKEPDQAGEPGARRDPQDDGQAGLPEGPVFVDESGRRSRKYRRVGWALGVCCACYAVMLVVTVVGGNSTAPWLLIPGPAADKKTDTVKEPADPKTSPAPADPVPGLTAPPGPVGVVAPMLPKPRTTISNGVRVTVPPKPGKKPAVAVPGASVPARPAPGSGSSALPAPGGPLPITGGSTEPSPSPSASPDPVPSTSASVTPPEQSASPESAPAPQKAHRRK
ncbi:hypothetical protein AB0436_13605 [Streptomyces sp. NPDC051322]|uniref:hypothetical protein n=1 Tax=Streptomyces sp. NPDC051322 TaxID=3154645 RepID=UPI003450B292